jgi:hypothetical protein
LQTPPRCGHSSRIPNDGDGSSITRSPHAPSLARSMAAPTFSSRPGRRSRRRLATKGDGRPIAERSAEHVVSAHRRFWSSSSAIRDRNKTQVRRPGFIRDHGAGRGLADPWLRSPSSLAIHNIGSAEGRQHAVEEAPRVLRTGGRLVVVDIMHAADNAQRLTSLGLSDVAQRPLGWRYWYGGPWVARSLGHSTKACRLKARGGVSSPGGVTPSASVSSRPSCPALMPCSGYG